MHVRCHLETRSIETAETCFFPCFLNSRFSLCNITGKGCTPYGRFVPPPHCQLWSMKTETAGFRLAVLALAVFVQVTALRFAAQPWHCSCQSWSVWAGNVVSSHNSQHLLDPYSLTHVLHGIALAGLLWLLPRSVGAPWRFALAAALEAAWELLENSPLVINRYRTATISLDYYGDSVVNSVGDLLACLGGFLLAERLGFKRSVILFAITELVLLAWIRDCLTLNILMLTTPVEAIRIWQGRGLQ